jgi:hypothetical protein
MKLYKLQDDKPKNEYSPNYNFKIKIKHFAFGHEN